MIHERLSDIQELKKDYLDALRDLGFGRDISSIDRRSVVEQLPGLKGVLAGSLYPKIAQIVFPQQKYRDTMTGAVPVRTAHPEPLLRRT